MPATCTSTTWEAFLPGISQSQLGHYPSTEEASPYPVYLRSSIADKSGFPHNKGEYLHVCVFVVQVCTSTYTHFNRGIISPPKCRAEHCMFHGNIVIATGLPLERQGTPCCQAHHCHCCLHVFYTVVLFVVSTDDIRVTDRLCAYLVDNKEELQWT